ncbi:hypothetical protein [Rhizobium sp. NFACC06-2]|uniref:hypothetical protein n=1 Tax=Rhizobium sp. NFACC06-2 TaxID=1566264 RepID=UPI000876B7EB|nr:hypothetical protein [Rhizobium sp. NFACC06-2]SCY50710.1 hypothetical protein SAMN03159288_02803 [Rhizobium sp. NFACC06-2]
MSLRTGSALALLFFTAATAAHADEAGLIWKPVKNSDRSYTARIGAKLPVDTPIRAGLEMGMSASKTGQVVDTPVRVWGNVTLLAEQLPGVSLARDVGVIFNALTGSSSVSVTSQQKRIVTPELDIEANRNFTVRYDGTAQQWNGLDVSQSLRLSRSETGTAFVLTGASRNSFNEFSSGVAVEQKLGDHLTVRGTLDQGYADHFRPGVSARYSIRW